MKPKGGRRRSREIALQILYAMEVTDLPPEESIHSFYGIFDEEDSEIDIPLAARPFAEQLVQGVELHQAEIDRLISLASEHWRLERMSIVDRNILRLAIYEMLYCPDIPLKVSLNEAIDLGKAFGSPDSGAFINGVLDHLLPEVQKRSQARATSEEPKP